MAPIAQVIGARRGLFTSSSSSERRHSDPQTKGETVPATAKGATAAGPGTKSKPKPLKASPSHTASKAPRKPSAGSPEVEEAKDAMSPSAFGTPPIASTSIQLDLDSAGSSTANIDEEDSFYQPITDVYADQSTLPPTLSKSKAPPLSLMPIPDSQGSNLESPKLLPPASEARVRSLSLTTSDTTRTTTVTTVPLVSPFACKSPATIDVNPISASGNRSEMTSVESAQASLARLSQSWKDSNPDLMELKPIRQPSLESDDHPCTSTHEQQQKSPEELETQMSSTDLNPEDEHDTPSSSESDNLWVGISDKDSLSDTKLSVGTDSEKPSPDLETPPSGCVPTLDESLQKMVQAQNIASSSRHSSPLPPGEIV